MTDQERMPQFEADNAAQQRQIAHPREQVAALQAQVQQRLEPPGQRQPHEPQTTLQ